MSTLLFGKREASTLAPVQPQLLKLSDAQIRASKERARRQFNTILIPSGNDWYGGAVKQAARDFNYTYSTTRDSTDYGYDRERPLARNGHAVTPLAFGKPFEGGTEHILLSDKELLALPEPFNAVHTYGTSYNYKKEIKHKTKGRFFTKTTYTYPQVKVYMKLSTYMVAEPSSAYFQVVANKLMISEDPKFRTMLVDLFAPTEEDLEGKYRFIFNETKSSF